MDHANLDISYNDFVRLFVNHRPNIDLTFKEFHQALRLFHESIYTPHSSSDGQRLFESSIFVEKLMTTGNRQWLYVINLL